MQRSVALKGDQSSNHNRMQRSAALRGDLSSDRPQLSPGALRERARDGSWWLKDDDFLVV
jgi:hypothetical protein